MKIFILTGIILLVINSPVVYAQVGILPNPSIECTEEGPTVNGKKTYILISDMKKATESIEGFQEYVKQKPENLENALGCAIKTGRVRLYMVPFFATFIIQFLLQIAGIIAVLFMIYGGYNYVVGGISEDKESGKKTIQYALIGLIVALSAWIIVNLVQVALTS